MGPTVPDRSGLLISFEGPEGSGKSTLIAALADELRTVTGAAPLVLREPGGTRVGERIREVLLDAELTELLPETELLLMVASRAQLVRQEILPALKAGRVVLCDRYADASVAYQGGGRELGVDAVHRLNDYAVDDAVPDLTLLCLLSPEQGRARIQARNPDRLEQEDAAFHDRVHVTYRAMADSGDSRFQVIDAAQDPQGVLEQTLTVLRKLEHELLSGL